MATMFPPVGIAYYIWSALISGLTQTRGTRVGWGSGSPGPGTIPQSIVDRIDDARHVLIHRTVLNPQHPEPLVLQDLIPDRVVSLLRLFAMARAHPVR
jgi:hypothetical protein